MTPPRLLHVVLSLNPGGAERLVIDMVRWQRRSAEVAVCCLDEAGAWAGDLASEGVTVEVLHRQPGFHPGLGTRLASLTRRFGATVVHCHQYSPFVYGALARLRTTGVRLIVTEHGRLAGERQTLAKTMLTRVLARVPDAIVAVSDELRRDMIRGGYPARALTAIRNGIDPGANPVADDRRHARAALGISGDEAVVGTIARLDPVKDLGTLLSAMATPSGPVAGARLVVVGDGPDHRALQQQASDLGFGHRVCWTGMRRDARELVHAFDVFANTSTSEGVSVTLLEAMAAGIPVVATAAGGTPEVVEHGETGILVPIGDASAVREAVASLLRDPGRRRLMGQRARARVIQSFSFERMMQAYQALYAGAALPGVS